MKADSILERIGPGKLSILISIFSAITLVNSASAVDIASLPMYEPEKMQTKDDWLIKPTQTHSGVFRTQNENEIVLSNGLISRTFRLAPNAATVGLDNLITAQSIIRGVKPEAVVTIDGITYEIGGLKGQPNYAFLRPEWIDALKADNGAFKFVGFEVGKPKERMQWKQVRYHAPNLQWPPKGVYLRMDYQLPDSAFLQSKELLNSSDGREILIEDNFTSLDEKWQIHKSNSNERCSFINEGKPGEIMTPANTCVFAERSLPAETSLVEAEILFGTDKSASWGPGIALVWPNRTIKFNVGTGGFNVERKAAFNVFDGSNEHYDIRDNGKAIDTSVPWTLRMRIEADTLYCEAKPKAGSWKTYKTVKLDTTDGAPKAIRIGKMGKRGDNEDFGEPGEMVRLKIERFAAYSRENMNKLTAQSADFRNRQKIKVSVHYELYDSIPCLSKWITVHNNTDKPVKLNTFTSEILAAVEYGAAVEARKYIVSKPNIHVETDYCFGSFDTDDANRKAVHWEKDPDYLTQVNYMRTTPCLLKIQPELGPNLAIPPAQNFESFRTFIMPHDSFDRERQGLAQRRMYRTIAPWVTENPLMMHARFADWDRVKIAIDQCAEVGFEMVILTFGSGFNIENENTEYLAQMKKYADYARSKGLEIGGYSLLASRSVGAGNDVVMPEGESPTFGNSPCLGSKWGQDYFRKLYQFYEKTGFMLLEHDGSYPGDVCTSTEHPGHVGYEDSRWKQWKIISDFYKWCRGKGIYLNVPDYYYLAGSNKCGMGYRETNWSLPRDQQVIHTRQNIFDGAWQKTPSMGWMFVPLTQYHGGGAAATIEPLNEHLDHYRLMLMSNLGAGVQACYRGPRLYDTDQTKAMVTQCVNWYKKHREVLEGDLIHLRRPDSRDIDYWLNVNPFGTEKGLLMVFNPLPHPVQKTITVPLYYTGLTDKAQVSHEDNTPQSHTLARNYSITLNLNIPAKDFTWFVLK
ncbi:MAG: hypothetical protein JXD22_05515 [Sedimentisphaerales bacterium]|nr:hypothetical protein [Sedimentisphaerales bacterium]